MNNFFEDLERFTYKHTHMSPSMVSIRKNMTINFSAQFIEKNKKIFEKSKCVEFLYSKSKNVLFIKFLEKKTECSRNICRKFREKSISIKQILKSNIFNFEDIIGKHETEWKEINGEGKLLMINFKKKQEVKKCI